MEVKTSVFVVVLHQCLCLQMNCFVHENRKSVF